jgi:membrane protein YdbS with pleckstrin-like domain
VTTEIADGERRALDPRYIDLQILVGRITFGVLVVGAAVGLLMAILITPLGSTAIRWLAAGAVAALIGLGWWFERWPAVEYRHASYRVDQAGLEIARGVYWRSVINIPKSRIQHTDVSQGPLERRHGLGTLVIHTAGNEYASVELPGLPYDSALLIRDHLLPRDLRDVV